MEEEPSSTLSESRLYALLAHQRRRLILQILQDFPAPLSAAELTDILADCEYTDPTDGDRQRVLLSLYHNHLPRLNDAAVLEYDRDSGRIRRGPNYGVLVGLIEDEWEEENARFAD